MGGLGGGLLGQYLYNHSKSLQPVLMGLSTAAGAIPMFFLINGTYVISAGLLNLHLIQPIRLDGNPSDMLWTPPPLFSTTGLGEHSVKLQVLDESGQRFARFCRSEKNCFFFGFGDKCRQVV